MTRITRSLAVAQSALLLALIAAAPALADGEPPQPLAGHTTHLVVTGIVVAAIVVAAWLALFRMVMALRRSRKKALGREEGRP